MVDTQRRIPDDDSVSQHIVSPALPAASGTVYIEHLFDVLRTDIQVRALKMSGQQAQHVGAIEADTKEAPKEFSAYGIQFDALKPAAEKAKTQNGTLAAQTFRVRLDPIYLRYYFGTKLEPATESVEFVADEFMERINAELVNTLANLVSRSSSFLKTRLTGRYSRLKDEHRPHLDEAAQLVEMAQKAYLRLDHAEAIRCALKIAELGNKVFQDSAPWNLIKTDADATVDIATLCLNLARAATVTIAPVIPSFAAKVYGVLGIEGEPAAFDEATAFDLVDKPMGKPVRLVDRLSRKQLNPLVEAAQKPDEKTKSEAPPEMEPIAEQIDIERFMTVDLRVGLILDAQRIKKAKKLLQLSVDLSEAKPRTIFAGIAQAYEPEKLIGTKVAVVANLAPRKMSFGVSEGMVLAAGPGGTDLQVVKIPDEATPGSRIR